MKLHARARSGLDARRVPVAREPSRVDVPPRAPVPPVADPRPRRRRIPHTSVWAVFALITGVVAVAGGLTGVLVVPAALLGVVAVVMAVFGLRATGRLHVTGRGVAVLGLLFGLAAVAVGVVAVAGVVPWWDSSNHVAWLGNWLDGRVPWLVTGS